MNSQRFIVAFAAIWLIGFALAAYGDGKVTTGNTNPVTTWKIDDLRFVGLADSRDVAIVLVKFYRSDASVDHVEEVSVGADEYRSLLAAINTSSGTDEGTLLITNPDGSTSPDLGAIFRLRISRWMVAHGKIAGVTAEPVTFIFTQPDASSAAKIDTPQFIVAVR